MSCFARVLDPQGFIGSGSREHNARCLGSASSVCEIASKVPAQEEVAEGSDARQLLLQLASSMPTSLTSPVSRPPCPPHTQVPEQWCGVWAEHAVPVIDGCHHRYPCLLLPPHPAPGQSALLMSSFVGRCVIPLLLVLGWVVCVASMLLSLLLTLSCLLLNREMCILPCYWS